MKKITFFGMSAFVALSLTLQGCTDTQQAAAVGGIIGAAIGIAASDSGGSRHHRRPPPPPPRQCHGGYRQSCTTFTDYYGYTSTRCHSVYDGCASFYQVEFDGKPQATLFVSEENAQVAQDWALSFEGAATVTSAVKSLKGGDLSAAAQFGLTSADLNDLAQGRELNGAAVDNVAKALDIQFSQAQKMIRVITEKAQAKLARPQSN